MQATKHTVIAYEQYKTLYSSYISNFPLLGRTHCSLSSKMMAGNCVILSTFTPTTTAPLQGPQDHTEPSASISDADRRRQIAHPLGVWSPLTATSARGRWSFP